ncbi:MAG: sodium:solute symporter [Brevibacillus sp.]|nr:sodium:solute symporter [Brevibacillus sp.]
MSIIDVSIIIIYFIAILFIGYLGSKKARTSEDYIVAGRNLGFFMYLGCLAAVILGGASTMGTAKEGYTNGFGGIWIVTMLGLGIVAIGLFLINKLTGLKVLTISEMLHNRFGSGSQSISAIVAAIYAMLVTTTQVIGIGKILHILVGWDLDLSMIIGGGIVLAYTILGGMWSVTMTDIVQFVVMTVGIFFIFFPISLSKAGGWSSITATLPAEYFSIANIDGELFAAYFLAFCLGMVVAQDIWQRVFTAKNVKVAKAGTIGAGIYSFLYAIAIVMIGMCAFIVVPDLEDPENAFAAMALEILPTGVAGIVFAAVISALMSTASGTLLASSTLIINDLIKPRMPALSDERRFLLASRFTTFAIGIISIVFALTISSVTKALLIAYAFLAGAIFFPVILGFFWKGATAKGAFYSILASSLAIGVSFFYYPYYANEPIFVGLGVSFVTIIIVSLLTAKQPEKA